MTERHPIWKLLDQIQMDNRAAAAKLVELRGQVAALGLTEPKATVFVNGPVTAPTCEGCGCGGHEHAYDCPTIHTEIIRASFDMPGAGEEARADAQYGAELARAVEHNAHRSGAFARAQTSGQDAA